MAISNRAAKEDELDTFARIIHLGLMVFGILAWITSTWAGDYKRAHHLGFTVHSWLGLGLAFFMALRLIYGVMGPDNVRFKQWVPYTRDRLRLVGEDILTLLKFQLPDRPTHQGLSGLVHAFGLAVFSWMAITGSLMFLYLQPGHKARGILHLLKEIHELGNWLIAIFLGLHVVAVLLHALMGDHRWRKMLFCKE
jgi:cytochrome b